MIDNVEILSVSLIKYSHIVTVLDVDCQATVFNTHKLV